MFLNEAAATGFHVIWLTHDNTTAIGLSCLNNLACFGTTSQNVFNGSRPSRFSAVSPRDGVEHGLVVLLSYLKGTYPNEGRGRSSPMGVPTIGPS